jgi:hypothetical protein
VLLLPDGSDCFMLVSRAAKGRDHEKLVGGNMALNHLWGTMAR